MAPSQAPENARVGTIVGRPPLAMAPSQALPDRSGYAIAALTVIAG
jgi:hypothetical protein